MDFLVELIKSEYLSIIFGGLAGVITAWLSQRILHKRGVFRYHVNHSRVGISTSDDIHGNVQVLWDQNPIRDLYLSTIEMKNESFNDYDDITIKVYTSNTNLLTEETGVLGTIETLKWTDEYTNKVSKKLGQEFTESQKNTYFNQREYSLPIFNRGQTVRITYLNTPTSDNTPQIWMSIIKKGVKLKFDVPKPLFLGVPQTHAALVGMIFGLILIMPLIAYVETIWIVALTALIYGYFAIFPGVLVIKIYRKIKDIIGG